jgi:hypothetical protein
MVENKYDRFFESVKSFVLETHLAFPEDIEGLSQDQIRLIEKRYGVSLPLAFGSYLRYFGKKSKIINTDYYLDFSQKMIDKVMQEIEEWEVLYRVSEQKTIENRLDHKNYPMGEVLDLSTILFTQLLEHLDTFIFIECKDENPMVQHFEKLYDERKGGFRGYGYHPGELSFVGTFRYLLFIGISTKFFSRDIMNDKERIALYDRINLDNVAWSKYYVDNKARKMWYDIKDEQRRSFYKIKQEFIKEIDDQEIQTGIVMTIDEFEWAFIEHLRGLGVDI